MGLADEVGQHPFGDLEVGDDAVLQRPDGNDVGWRASQHVLGLSAHGFHRARGFVDGHDGGFIDHNSLALGVNQGVGRAQVYGEVAGKEVEGSSKTHSAGSSDGFGLRCETSCPDPGRRGRQPCCDVLQHSKVPLNLQTLNRHWFGGLLSGDSGSGIMAFLRFVRCWHTVVAPLTAARTGECEDQ